MSVQSISNALSPQEIQQILQQMQLASADPNGTSTTTADSTAADGQNLPTGTNAQDDETPAAAPVTSGQAPLDPKTVLALLQIQEGQQMEQADTLIFGDTAGSGSTGDPLLDALNAQGSNGPDFGQSMLDSLNTSSNTNSDISGAAQQLLNSLNASGAGASTAADLDSDAQTDDTSTGTAATAAATTTAPPEDET